MPELYSMENALQFNWSSVSNELNPERQAFLDTYAYGNKVLDAGCGGGSYVTYLTDKGFDCKGVENFQEFVDFANKNSSKERVIQGDITALPFPDKCFDTTFCFDVLEHVDDYSSISELERVTTKRILVAVPKTDIFFKKYNLTFLHYQDKSHLRTYDEDMLRNLIESIPYKSFFILNELSVPQHVMIRDITKASICADNGKLGSYLFNKALNFLLSRIQYNPIYTGLVAVVDLT